MNNPTSYHGQPVQRWLVTRRKIGLFLWDLLHPNNYNLPPKKKKKPLIIAGQKQYQLQSRIKGIEEEMGGFGKQALVNQ